MKRERGRGGRDGGERERERESERERGGREIKMGDISQYF